MSCYAYRTRSPLTVDDVEWNPLPGLDGTLPPAPDTAVILDSYHLRPPEIADRGPVVTFHDGGPRPDGAAMVISIAGAGLDARDDDLVGLEYAALRSGFWDPPERRLSSTVSRVLVTTGGGDPRSSSASTADAIADLLPGAKVVVVVGRTVSLPGAKRFQVLRSPASLRSELAKADLVVGGGGQTALEAAALGTPYVAIQLAENQRSLIGILRRAGAVQTVNGGGDDLPAVVQRLCAEPGRRHALSRGAQTAVDGNGALRVARAITRFGART